MAEQQECRVCGKTKDLTEFYSHQTTKNRRQTHCKECTKKMAVTHRINKQLENAYLKLHMAEEKLRELNQ